MTKAVACAAAAQAFFETDVAASSTCGTSCSSAFSAIQRVVGSEMFTAAAGRSWR